MLFLQTFLPIQYQYSVSKADGGGGGVDGLLINIVEDTGDIKLLKGMSRTDDNVAAQSDC